MPFMKNNRSPNSRPSSSPVLPLLIGRSSELHIFVHEILQPGVPLYNILSISGQGGIGKSTLLIHFIAETQKAPFNDYCQTAIVDEHLADPVSIMERFAQQLHIAGTFEKALKRYKEALRKQGGRAGANE